MSSFTLSNDLVKLEVKPIPSFSKAPYVHPLIIKDFVGWISDRGAIIQSVDLLNAQYSNRYSGDIETRQDGETLWISCYNDGARISYSLQANLGDGKYALNVLDGSSGTYVGKHAILVQFGEETILLFSGPYLILLTLPSQQVLGYYFCFNEAFLSNRCKDSWMSFGP